MTETQKNVLNYIKSRNSEFGVSIKEAGRGLATIWKRKLIGFPKGARLATFDWLCRNEHIVLDKTDNQYLGKGRTEYRYLYKVILK